MNKQYRFKIIFLTLLTFGVTDLCAQGVALEWVKHMGSTSLCSGADVAIDDAGNVYTTGYFFGKVDFDPGPDSFFLNSAYGSWYSNAFIQKSDKDGNFIWAKKIPDNSGLSTGFNIISNTIALDEQGNVYIGGLYESESLASNNKFDFNPGSDTFYLNVSGDYVPRAFLLKLDSLGNFVWAKGFEGNGSSAIEAITIDGNNVYATGQFSGSVNFGGQTLMSGIGTSTFYSISVFLNQPINNPFIIKLNTDGAINWVKSFFVDGYESLSKGITVDDSKNVYVTGSYAADSSDFDPGPGTYNMPTAHHTINHSNLFVAKLDSAGNFVWAKQLLSNLYSTTIVGVYLEGFDIEADHYGNIYIGGRFTNFADFDPDTAASAAYYMYTDETNQQSFVLKLDTSGSFVWAKKFSARFMNSGGIAVDQAGNVYNIGTFKTFDNSLGLIVDFDPGSDTFTLGNYSPFRDDIYIVKLGKEGNFLWAKNFQNARDAVSGHDSYGSAIEVDRSGSVYTTGYFTGQVDFDPNQDTVWVTSLVNATGFPRGNVANIFVHKMICADTNSSVLTDTGCNSYTLNNEQYTESGTYVQKLVNISGCDSTVVLNLTLYHIDAEVTVDGFNLSTTQSYITYQWLLNGVVIPGAIDRTYTVTANGDYQVVVTNEDGCIDTSAIYPVTNVSINDINDIGRYIAVYPNPANDVLHIKSPIVVDAVLTSIDGRDMLKMNNAQLIPIKKLPDGIYYLRFIDKEDRLVKVEKLVKQ